MYKIILQVPSNLNHTLESLLTLGASILGVIMIVFLWEFIKNKNTKDKESEANHAAKMQAQNPQPTPMPMPMQMGVDVTRMNMVVLQQRFQKAFPYITTSEKIEFFCEIGIITEQDAKEVEVDAAETIKESLEQALGKDYDNITESEKIAFLKEKNILDFGS